jgi:hypothetical protein
MHGSYFRLDSIGDGVRMEWGIEIAAMEFAPAIAELQNPALDSGGTSSTSPICTSMINKADAIFHSPIL